MCSQGTIKISSSESESSGNSVGVGEAVEPFIHRVGIAIVDVPNSGQGVITAVVEAAVEEDNENDGSAES